MTNLLLMAPLQRAKGQSQIQETEMGMAYICDTKRQVTMLL